MNRSLVLIIFFFSLLYSEAFAHSIKSFGANAYSGFEQGPQEIAKMTQVFDLVKDNQGNYYATNYGAHFISKISANGVHTMLAGSTISGDLDGALLNAKFLNPRYLVYDAISNSLYVSDYGNHKIKKINLNTSQVTTLAGTTAGYLDGPSGSAQLRNPSGLALDLATNKLYFSDSGNRRIRVINLNTSSITTLAGSGLTGFLDGPLLSAKFSTAMEGLYLDNSILYLADANNHRLRSINLNTSTLSTIAGTGLAGDQVGPALSSALNTPRGLCLKNSNLYFTDSFNHKIKKISSGQITTVAGLGSGYADGDETQARFFEPAGLLCPQGSTLDVADYKNNTLRHIELDLPYQVPDVKTIAGLNLVSDLDGVLGVNRLSRPRGIVKDSLGNIYISDSSSHKIKKLDISGNLTTYAGSGSGYIDGLGIAAKFNSPMDLAIDSSDNIYVADSANHRIRKIAPGGMVTTIAGSGIAGFLDGPDLASNFNSPRGIAVNDLGEIFISDTGNHRIRKLFSGQVITLAGSSSGYIDGETGRFSSPWDIDLDASSNLFIVDSGNNTIRKLQYLNGKWITSTLAGGYNSGYKDGKLAESLFNAPTYLAITPDSIYVADTGNKVIRKIQGDNVQSIAGNALAGFLDSSALKSSFLTPEGLEIASNNLLIADTARLRSLDLSNIATAPNPSDFDDSFELVTVSGSQALAGHFDGVNSIAKFNKPHGMIFDLDGNLLIADRNNHRIRKMSPDGTVTTLTGTGIAGNQDGDKSIAQFNQPSDLAIDSLGNIFVADYGSNLIRKIDTSGMVTTFAGDPNSTTLLDGQGSLAKFRNPIALAIDANDNLYVSDYNNNAIRQITPSAQVSTLVGSVTAGYLDASGLAARFNRPWGLALSPSGDLFVADSSNHRIRKIDKNTLRVSTVAGSSSIGFVDGPALSSAFNTPGYIKFDQDSNLIIADSENHKLRKLDFANDKVSTLAGLGIAGYKDSKLSEALMIRPRGLAIKNSEIYISEDTVNRIRDLRKINIPAPIIQIVEVPVPVEVQVPVEVLVPSPYPVTVPAVNQPPQLLLVNDLNFDSSNIFSILESTNLVLKVFAIDLEDGANVSLTWSSSIQGSLATNSKSINISSLIPGQHTIIVKAFDSKGLLTVLSFGINVVAKNQDSNDLKIDRNGDGKIDDGDRIVVPLTLADSVVNISKPKLLTLPRSAKLKAVAYELTETNAIQNDVSSQIIWEFTNSSSEQKEFLVKSNSLSLKKLPKGLITVYARYGSVSAKPLQVKVSKNSVKILN